ncbi:MAG: CAP domain-containing protein [Patescibacteria group bacterium]|nr:CAP domain-containing protein [Patescibacteria group bacterium]MCL5431529.1 CAP domain-containing protein [Patescibacteria group bacterium]
MRKVLEPFLHFFTPRHTNNHKARALHFSSLTTYIAVLLVLQIVFSGVAKFRPQILGYASNITVSDLLTDTNKDRAAAGVAPLTLNSELSQAATDKAHDMFTHQYWAHTSPQGRDPWSFIIAAGYHYLFAGENLARDFGDSAGVVSAWMNSPSHRENLLNDKYKDVGFAVVNGTLNGEETTLVVQEFGALPSGAPTVAAPSTPVPAALPVAQTPAPGPEVLPAQTIQPKFDLMTVTKTISMALIIMLVGILVVDSFLVSRRRIVRLSGHNLAHLFLLLAVLVAINVISRGVVL